MQAERWGSELLTEDVEYVDLSSRPFTVRSSDTEASYTASACISSTAGDCAAASFLIARF